MVSAIIKFPKESMATPEGLLKEALVPAPSAYPSVFPASVVTTCAAPAHPERPPESVSQADADGVWDGVAVADGVWDGVGVRDGVTDGVAGCAIRRMRWLKESATNTVPLALAATPRG